MANKRSCRKCGDYIPSRMTVEGKVWHLGSRKFCVKCSPLGSHNTKSDDPSRPAKRHGFEGYRSWEESEKQKHRQRVIVKGQQRKQELVRIAGGKCKLCSYDRCVRALTFHHIDASQKSFSLDTNSIKCKNWESVLAELAKCVLLCHNCHMEVHSGVTDISE